ncbi:MAG TPA: hypothetical protein VIC05_03505 [Solirubrobacteraceae bacterium]
MALVALERNCISPFCETRRALAAVLDEPLAGTMPLGPPSDETDADAPATTASAEASTEMDTGMVRRIRLPIITMSSQPVPGLKR